MKKKAAWAGAAFVLAEIAVVCALATKDTPPLTSIPPRVLSATLAAPVDGEAKLAVSAQDPDGTITALHVRWADGQTETVTFPCRKDDYGGATIQHTLDRKATAAALSSAEVRATAKSCFGASDEHDGDWVAAKAG